MNLIPAAAAAAATKIQFRLDSLIPGQTYSFKEAERILNLPVKILPGNISKVEEWLSRFDTFLNEKNDKKETVKKAWGDIKNTALHRAARAGNIGGVNSYLGHGAEVNARNKYGSTPLHCAVQRGAMDVIEKLLTDGADVDATDNLGRTALILAAEGVDMSVVEFLIKKGAAVDIKDCNGRTALYYKIHAGNYVPCKLDSTAKETDLVTQLKINRKAEMIAYDLECVRRENTNAVLDAKETAELIAARNAKKERDFERSGAPYVVSSGVGYE